MKSKIIEQASLFISVLRWFVLATIIGCIAGVGTTIFLKLLTLAMDIRKQFEYGFLLLPAAFFVSALIVKYLAPDAEGHGTEKVIEAIHKYNGKIKWRVVPVKLVATIITLVSGGSAGKEGPCAQIGAGLASIFADVFRFDEKDRKIFVICGISAGFSSVFGTPIAGALFGVEVLFVGSVMYDVLLPSFIAGVTSYHVSSALGITYFYRPINFVPQFDEFFFAQICLAGVYFGLCALLLIETLKIGKFLSKKINLWMPLKGLMGGGLLVLLALCTSKQYLGLGLTVIESCLEGHPVSSFAPFWKMIFTSVTLNFGGSGGVVTPIFFVGATAGSLFATWTGLDPATLAAIGFVAVLAGAANTPIAASIMAIEVFGTQVAPYATVACIISFLITGHRSVYDSQVFTMRKTPSVDVVLGKEDEKFKLHPKKK